MQHKAQHASAASGRTQHHSSRSRPQTWQDDKENLPERSGSWKAADTTPLPAQRTPAATSVQSKSSLRALRDRLAQTPAASLPRSQTHRQAAAPLSPLLPHSPSGSLHISLEVRHNLESPAWCLMLKLVQLRLLQAASTSGPAGDDLDGAQSAEPEAVQQGPYEPGQAVQPWQNPVWTAQHASILQAASLMSSRPAQVSCSCVACQMKRLSRQRCAVQDVQLRHLQRCQLVGQFDNKFLILKAGGLLFIMDQHAADERVRLERLQQQVCAALLGSARWASPQLPVSAPCAAPELPERVVACQP